MVKKFNFYLAGWIAWVWLGMVQFGYMMGEFTLISNLLPWIYNLDILRYNDVASILATAGPIGAFFGAIAAGLMSYRGRRFWLFFANSLIMIAVCLRMMPWLYTALIARVLFGFAVGIFSTIVPLFVIEISPILLKGTNGSFIQLGVTSGILLAYLMGSTAPNYESPLDGEHCDNYDGGGNYWRLILAFPFIPSLIQIILLIFVFKLDTPKYYWIIQNFTMAKITLTKIHLNTMNFDNNESLTTAEGTLFDIMDYIDPNPDGRTLQSLGKKKYRRAFLVGVMLWIIQQMSGINLVIFYVNKIIQTHN
jgi:MFS family permease